MSASPARARLAPLILVAAAIWHGASVGAGIGSTDLPEGRQLATSWYAAQLVGLHGDPYDADALSREAERLGRPDRVARPFQPPAYLVATSWARRVDLDVAWAAWLAFQEVLLLGVALALWHRWRPLGDGPRLAFAGALALMGAVPVALDWGTPTVALLGLLLAAWYARAEVEAGALLGLAALVDLRAALWLPLWVARGRWVAAGAALVAHALGTAAAAAAWGIGPTRTFWTAVLPAALGGDFTGLNLRVDAFGNHAPAWALAALLPGPNGLALSAASLAVVWALGAASVGGLAAWHREPAPPDRDAAILACWLLLLVLVPAFGHETALPLALPACALAAAGAADGSLDRRLAVPVGLALAGALYPLEPLRDLHDQLRAADRVAVAHALHAVRTTSLLALAGCALWLSRPGRSV